MPNRLDGQDGETGFEASFEGTRKRQLTLGLAATPAERLRWLEEMLNREGRELGTRVERQRDNSFVLRWG